MEERYDAIVVGAGFGGSICAALLAHRGVRTLLIDKNATAGGKALTFSKRGFRYEFWPMIGGPSLNSRIGQALEEIGLADRVPLILRDTDALSVIYRAEDGSYRRASSGAVPQPLSPDTLTILQYAGFPDLPRSGLWLLGGDLRGVTELLGLDPGDLPELLRVLRDMFTMSTSALDELDEVPFAEFLKRYRLARSAQTYFTLWSNFCFVTPPELLATGESVRTFRDFALRGAIRYGRGGYGRVAEVCAESVERDGGRVLFKTRAERILVEHGEVAGVVTARGTFRAPIVISNAGLQPTVLRLVGEEHFQPPYVTYVKSLVPSWGAMGIRYFLKRPVFDAGENVLFADDNVLDAARFEAFNNGKLPRDVLTIITVPSVFDPELAPAGKQCAIAATLCSADPKAENVAALWDRLDETVMRVWPEMREAVEVKERYDAGSVSALTRESVLPGQGGEAIGIAQIVGQCGRSKPPARSPLPGLFYVGCDAGGYGAGTHQAADSGINVADLVTDEHRTRSGPLR